jgi:crossover junction endodeoxyribonuclease RusA
MLPFEFTVEGPPVSYQSRNRTRLRAWRLQVRDAAAQRWSGPILADVALRIVVTYYHEGRAIRMDNDNLLKPIQDALIGLVYVDDRQLTDTSVRKTDIDGLFYIRGASSILLEAFAVGSEFLHIQIEAAPSHARFQR